MGEDDLSYPLHWPVGRPRTSSRTRAAFATRSGGAGGLLRPLTPAEGRDRVLDELDRLKAFDVVISSNLGGLSRAEPRDPGVAVYFNLRNGKAASEKHCLACDRWDRVADNLAAIAAHVEAIRGQLRWGVGDVAQAFAGYKALPAVRAWWEVLGVAPNAPPAAIKARRRELLERHHPDRGGDPAQAAEVNAAYAAAVQSGAASENG